MSDADPFIQIQEDNAARLSAEPYFADIAIIPFSSDSTEDKLVERLGVAKGRSGKVGACVLVQVPTVRVPLPNVPGPQFSVQQTFLVLVHPEINAGSCGTKKAAGAIARQVVRLFHHARVSVQVQTWNAAADAVVPETALAKLTGYTVSISAALGQDVSPRVATPSISIAGSAATLACATPGAAIWYTRDGSLPWSGNPAASLYGVSFVPASSCVVRAVAYLADYLPSNASSASITITLEVPPPPI